MQACQYFFGEPAKSSFAQRAVISNAHDDGYDYEHVSLSTYSELILMLLDTYALEDVIAEADTALHNLKMAPHDTPTKFATAMMRKSLPFCPVYTKLHLPKLFIVGLTDNLRDMARQKMAHNPRATYDKLARYDSQLRKVTKSTSGKGDLGSRSATPSVNLVTPPPKLPASTVDNEQKLLLLNARLERSTTSSLQGAGVQVPSTIDICDCKLCLWDHHVTTSCPVAEN